MISIQGPQARGFYLDAGKLTNFNSVLRGIIGHQFLLISSKFRTDILYFSEVDQNKNIIKLLCREVGKEYDKNQLEKFFRTTDKQSTFEQYFLRLMYLSSRSQWYSQYIAEAQQVLVDYSQNKVSIALKDCIDHVHTNTEFDAIEFQSLTCSIPLENKDLKSVALDLLSSFLAN
ncbi:hypothetical protein [Fulvivirga lutimaris]|uniref:hypothetical protein n=1 Tax=Fulvivirga lutimaris TaxID=1819566 RepID=UPI0012BB9D1E|nr:hypothetical protein [Fulvivirga lutimaris]MTI39445.1 hypothetical protein [Fulvivirga lutimaris]